MSRIGKKPIEIPKGAQVKFSEGVLEVKGLKGSLQRTISPEISVEITEKNILLSPKKITKKNNALWGLMRTLVDNMLVGVSTGFDKKLEIRGIGYKATLTGDNLTFNLGFSHPILFNAPKGISFLVEKNIITVSGIDKEMVGQTAANIRDLKKPEPYKGKGIRYVNEFVRIKAGKKSAAGS